jgi:hypothetical protein
MVRVARNKSRLVYVFNAELRDSMFVLVTSISSENRHPSNSEAMEVNGLPHIETSVWATPPPDTRDVSVQIWGVPV